MIHVCTGETPYPGEHIFSCPQCSYRVVITAAGRTVINRGDPDVNHKGSIGPVTMTVEVQP